MNKHKTAKKEESCYNSRKGDKLKLTGDSQSIGFAIFLKSEHYSFDKEFKPSDR